MAFLGAIGIGVSAYLTYTKYASGDYFCGGLGSCDYVNTSSYATLAGVPVSILGLFAYLGIFALAVYGGRSNSSLAFNLTDGVLRVALFLGYVSGISFMKDIRRVFEYHGAEHKAIAAYEAGVDLTVENAKHYSCIHPRCGTSFLLAVVALSIIVFSLIPGAWPLWAKAASRVVLLQVIAGLSYEFIKYTAKKRGRPLIELVIRPGLWLQRLTTREPSGDQIEVAIRALNEALAVEPR